MMRKAVKNQIFKPGDKVSWMWLGRLIVGKVIEVHYEPITKLIKGKNIKRNGSKEKPAYLVESSAGNLALKLQSELTSLDTQKKNKKTVPKMFG